MDVAMLQILDAREDRARRQRELLAQYGKTLLCFTMNIAGPGKISPLIDRGFAIGNRLLRQQLMREKIPVLHFEERCTPAGNEGLYVLDCTAAAAKKIGVLLEENTDLGRLFDMDVMDREGKAERQQLGFPARKCLICQEPARICGRSRVHSLEQLQEKTHQILEQGIRRWESRYIARLAVQALLYEVGTTPKPGLVDRCNSGSHRDMDFFTFQASAAALWPYFQQCVLTGMDTRHREAGETLKSLRRPGMLAEGEMLAASGGVNTHKGAVFSLGVLCAALGRVGQEHWREPETVLAECAAMAEGLTETDFAGLTMENAATAGQRLYLRHGVTGVRGQAEAGFPAVGQVGLPKLEEGLARGLPLNDAGCAALLAMMAAAEDTNLINRSDYESFQKLQREITQLLEKEPFPCGETLEQLDAEFIRRRLSPGGTADLLAMVYLLHFLKKEEL